MEAGDALSALEQAGLLAGDGDSTERRYRIVSDQVRSIHQRLRSQEPTDRIEGGQCEPPQLSVVRPDPYLAALVDEQASTNEEIGPLILPLTGGTRRITSAPRPAAPGRLGELARRQLPGTPDEDVPPLAGCDRGRVVRDHRIVDGGDRAEQIFPLRRPRARSARRLPGMTQPSRTSQRPGHNSRPNCALANLTKPVTTSHRPRRRPRATPAHVGGAAPRPPGLNPGVHRPVASESA